MTGGQLLAWFGLTVLGALIAWVRAEIAQARRSLIAPAVVLVVSLALLVAFHI